MKDRPVGEILKELRGQKKMSQKDLAMISQVSPDTISKIENGTTRPSRRTLWKLANALDKFGFEGAWGLTGGDQRVPGTNFSEEEIRDLAERRGKTEG